MRTHTEQWILSFVAGMVHSMGDGVSHIRHLAHSFRADADFSSPRAQAKLEQIAHEADRLAAGLRMMRYLGSADDHATVDFVVDILQPAVSLGAGLHSRLRLVLDASVRNAPRVKLRQGPAYLAVGELLAHFHPEVVRCRAKIEPSSVSFGLEFSGIAEPREDHAAPSLDGLFREAGVLSFESRTRPGDSGLVVGVTVGRES